MGRRGGQLRQPYRHRTATASLLILVAVAVPCAAWFYSGIHGVEKRTRLEVESATTKAYKKGVSLAARLATQLEVLREGESLRPFYHYQNLYHDPKGAADGFSVSISPLAQGPADSLIEAHFQVDDAGVLTLPTLNDEFPELGLHSSQEDQCGLFGQLKDITFFCTLESSAAALTYRPGDAGNGQASEGSAGSRTLAALEVLEAKAWNQHLLANAVYAELKYGKKSSFRSFAGGGIDEGKIEIKVGPFVWYTLPVGEAPGLVALRGVDTPAGVWTQGFVISHHAVDHYLESSPYPAAFRPSKRGAGAGKNEVTFAIAGTPWEIAFDIADSLRETQSRGAAESSRFLLYFWLGSAGAMLAGLLAIAMLYQSERLGQQRSRFAAAAAHELRTPLAGLRLYGDMLVEGLGDPQRARDYARRMAGEAERLGRVVTNVLSFTRLERESVNLHPEPGDLGPAVREILERLQPAIEESGARVEVDLEADLPTVSFDRDALGHILQNLLDNAEKYTRETPDRTIIVRAGTCASGIELSVEDNGKGIPPELRRRLFRAFARGHHPDAPEGLGLGLVLVRELVRAQGGEIRYDDAPAGGAIFTVTFPV
ncbi:MAG: HAMP domain-containing sensor histidine kinase [Acidobacteriota bacterium]